MYRTALGASDEGALVLTANRRLERHLRRCFDRRMIDRGNATWRTPNIFSVDDWVTRKIFETGEGWRLLDPVSALQLWERVIEEDAAGTELDLLQRPATARRAMEAHALLLDYRVGLEKSAQTEDQSAFSRWRQAYIEVCREEEWLDHASASDWVTEQVERGRIGVPKSIRLTGFDEIRPSLQRLARAFARAGGWVEECPPPVGPRGKTVRLRCLDNEDEIRRSVQWARRLVEEGATNIGIVVPRLTQWRSVIERVFREETAPDSLLPGSDDASRFGLSLGQKLSDQGLVVAALEILSVSHRLPMDRISYLLRTPYLGGAGSEGSRRALFEGELRSFRRAEISLNRLQTLAAEAKGGSLQAFSRICSRLADGLKGGGRRLPGAWAEHFSSLLEAVGWPGDRGLNSLEYQVLQAWREKLLPQILRLDRVCRPIPPARFVGLLRRLAAEIDFQPETPASPIQVIGYLEAAGLQFEHLWVMDLSDEVFPAPASPNPFIPFQLQRLHRMPHADAGRETEFARGVLDRLMAAAPNVVLSHPRRRGDCELRPSPLIKDIPPREDTTEGDRALNRAPEVRPVVLEWVLDHQGTALSEGSPVTGGTALLRDQALCPFRAFARHRLGARGLEEPEIGLDARTRGTLLHCVLEIFWSRTRSSVELAALSCEVRQQRIREAIDESLARDAVPSLAAVSPTLLQLEKERLFALTEEWLLSVDMKRPSFEVLQQEKESRESFGGITIKTKIDRLDRIGDGDLLVLDYKTGRVDFEDLLGERLLEPQLPVYGVGKEDDPPAGIAFAMVRRGDSSLKGLCRQEGFFTGGEAFGESKLAEKYGIDSWEELLARWRRQLEELGAEFASGEAAVRPVAAEKACRYCDLASLCRIDEQGLSWEAER